MASEVFQLYLLLQLKDMASGGLNHVEAHLRSMGKEGRAVLQTFQQLREGMKRDLAVAGLGVGTLAALKKGVDVAGDFESSIGDMRMSIEELGTDGKINVAKLNNEMGQLEALGLRIGNQLPGTTADFLEEFTALKQNGQEARNIVDGVGESVAYLSVISRQVPKELAEPFAQYAQQFQLTGEEAKKLADLLARIQFSTGMKPQELIEGSKFFQLRAGMPLGLTGLKGADIGGRVLATLRSYGLEGGIGGRELGGFMLSLTFNTKEKQKVLDELKQKKGIELQFFGKKGEFLGMDNAFKQMEQFRKLSTEEQLKFGEKLFDREGMAIASVFMKSGEEGWRKINARIDKVPPLQELINQKTSTYNAKLEAVKGTLTNLEATTFTPMLDTLKPVLDTSNEILGSLQGWAKEHPDIAKYLTTFAGFGGVMLTLVGVVRAGTTAWGLYTIASTAATRSLQAQAVAAGEATVATTAAGSRLLALRQMSAMKMTVTIAAAYVGFEVLDWLYKENQRYEKELAERRAEAQETGITGMQSLAFFGPRYHGSEAEKQLWQARSKLGGAKEGTPQFINAQIEMQAAQIKIDKEKARAETWERTAQQSWASFSAIQYSKLTDRQPVLGDKVYTGGERAQYIQELRGMTYLHDPNVLARLIRMGETGKLPSVQEVKPHGVFPGVEFGESLKEFKGLLSEAFSDRGEYQQAQAMAVEEMRTLGDQSKATAEDLKDVSKWFGPTNQLPQAFDRARFAVDRFSYEIANMHPSMPATFGDSFGKPTSSTDKPFTFGPSKKIPRMAVGGYILRGGLVEVHDREAIVPAQVTDRWRDPVVQSNFSDRFQFTSTTDRLRELRETTMLSPSMARPAPVSDRWREIAIQPRPMPEFRPEVARAIVSENRGQRSEVGGGSKSLTINGGLNVHLEGGADVNADDIAAAIARSLEIQLERL